MPQSVSDIIPSFARMLLDKFEFYKGQYTTGYFADGNPVALTVAWKELALHGLDATLEPKLVPRIILRTLSGWTESVGSLGTQLLWVPYLNENLGRYLYDNGINSSQVPMIVSWAFPKSDLTDTPLILVDAAFFRWLAIGPGKTYQSIWLTHEAAHMNGTVTEAEAQLKAPIQEMMDQFLSYMKRGNNIPYLSDGGDGSISQAPNTSLVDFGRSYAAFQRKEDPAADVGFAQSMLDAGAVDCPNLLIAAKLDSKGVIARGVSQLGAGVVVELERRIPWNLPFRNPLEAYSWAIELINKHGGKQIRDVYDFFSILKEDPKTVVPDSQLYGSLAGKEHDQLDYSVEADLAGRTVRNRLKGNFPISGSSDLIPSSIEVWLELLSIMPNYPDRFRKIRFVDNDVISSGKLNNKDIFLVDKEEDLLYLPEDLLSLPGEISVPLIAAISSWARAISRDEGNQPRILRLARALIDAARSISYWSIRPVSGSRNLALKDKNGNSIPQDPRDALVHWIKENRNKWIPSGSVRDGTDAISDPRSGGILSYLAFFLAQRKFPPGLLRAMRLNKFLPGDSYDTVESSDLVEISEGEALFWDRDITKAFGGHYSRSVSGSFVNLPGFSAAVASALGCEAPWQIRAVEDFLYPSRAPILPNYLISTVFERDDPTDAERSVLRGIFGLKEPDAGSPPAGSSFDRGPLEQSRTVGLDVVVSLLRKVGEKRLRIFLYALDPEWEGPKHEMKGFAKPFRTAGERQNFIKTLSLLHKMAVDDNIGSTVGAFYAVLGDEIAERIARSVPPEGLVKLIDGFRYKYVINNASSMVIRDQSLADTLNDWLGMIHSLSQRIGNPMGDMAEMRGIYSETYPRALAIAASVLEPRLASALADIHSGDPGRRRGLAEHMRRGAILAVLGYADIHGVGQDASPLQTEEIVRKWLAYEVATGASTVRGKNLALDIISKPGALERAAMQEGVLTKDPRTMDIEGLALSHLIKFGDRALLSGFLPTLTKSIRDLGLPGAVTRLNHSDPGDGDLLLPKERGALPNGMRMTTINDIFMWTRVRGPYVKILERTMPLETELTKDSPWHELLEAMIVRATSELAIFNSQKEQDYKKSEDNWKALASVEPQINETFSELGDVLSKLSSDTVVNLFRVDPVLSKHLGEFFIVGDNPKLFAMLSNSAIDLVVNNCLAGRPMAIARTLSAYSIAERSSVREVMSAINGLNTGLARQIKLRMKWFAENSQNGMVMSREVPPRNIFNPFVVLGVKRDATDAEITASYRVLAMDLHPDKNTLDDPHRAQILFNRVTEAYNILKDPVKKADILGLLPTTPDRYPQSNIFLEHP